MYAVDLHTHTRFFHGFEGLGRRFDPIGVRMLARVARARGLDAIVTTNHDFYREFPDAAGLTVLPGIEVTTTRGHVLIVGPEPPERTEPEGLTPEEAVELAHERDCAAIIAHPFRNSTVRTVDADFDAVEINGKGTESYDWVRRLAGERDLPLVAGSDAHYPIEVGRAFTVVEDSGTDGRAHPAEAAFSGAAERSDEPSTAPGSGVTSGSETRSDPAGVLASGEPDAPSPERVVSAIRDGRVRAYVDERPSQRLLRAGYRFTHGWKGWLDRPDWDPPGLGAPPGERDGGP